MLAAWLFGTLLGASQALPSHLKRRTLAGNASRQGALLLNGVEGSLPLRPSSSVVAALPVCEVKQRLVAWSHDTLRAHAKAAIAAWRAARPRAHVVLDTGAGSCKMDAENQHAPNASTQSELFTVVDATEDQLCADGQDKSIKRLPDYPREEFAVSGSLAQRFGKKRKHFAVWPQGQACTKESKCPLVVFFHGCGRYFHFEQMAKYDRQCFDSLGSVMLFPSTKKWTESWTASGTDMLDQYIIPLLEDFKRSHGDVIDESRVVAVGESLGSGIALQAALLRPDLFSSVVAMGITDGSTCNDVEHFHPEKLQIKAPRETEWKLKLLVGTFAEREANVVDRVSGLLGLIDAANATERIDVHFRLFLRVGHAQALDFAQNHWSGLHHAIWEGNVV